MIRNEAASKSLAGPALPTLLVRVPCSTSNIGPGFDTLGLALDLFNTFTFRIIDEAASSFVGRGTCAAFGSDGNVCLQMMAATEQAAREMGCLRTLPSVEVIAEGTVPAGIGLGSSATACVAGALAANVLLGNPLTAHELLAALTAFEGHPDNVTPSLLGGLTVSAVGKRGVIYRVHAPDPDWRVALIAPDYALSTREARRALPVKVRRRDAVFNLQRVPFVIEALVEGNAPLLREALADRLHEAQRSKYIRRYKRMRRAALESGAAAVFISGSGPALAAFCVGDMCAARVRDAMLAELADASFEADGHVLSVVGEGATVVREANTY